MIDFFGCNHIATINAKIHSNRADENKRAQRDQANQAEEHERELLCRDHLDYVRVVALAEEENSLWDGRRRCTSLTARSARNREGRLSHRSLSQGMFSDLALYWGRRGCESSEVRTATAEVASRGLRRNRIVSAFVRSEELDLAPSFLATLCVADSLYLCIKTSWSVHLDFAGLAGSMSIRRLLTCQLASLSSALAVSICMYRTSERRIHIYFPIFTS